MAKVVVIAERCKSCQYCIKFCPKNVLALGTKVNSKGYEYVEPYVRAHLPGWRYRSIQIKGD